MLVFLLLIAAAAGATPPNATERAAVSARLAAVDGLLRSGRFDEALAELAALDRDWSADPAFGWQVADRRGLALLGAERPLEALPLLEATVGRRPLEAGPHRNLALALARLDRKGRALAEYAQAAELAPTDPVLRLEHAQYLVQFHQWERAAAEFAVAAALCGGCVDAERGLGYAWLQAGQPARSIPALERVMDLGGEPDDRRRLLQALREAGRDSALLARLDGEDRQAWDRADHLAWVEAEGRLGGPAPRSLRYADALPAAEPAVAGDALFWARVALNLLNAGQPAAGLKAADRAIALEPDSAVYRNNRVVLLLKLGRDRDAEAEWQNVLRLDPSLKEQKGP
ncbi:MAG TPA: tetratricopeptide repeat protein [Candidatus Krumholzibacteria bacterium]|nr:tetratricopeptide repeat protein [Candidatus Krumholzibacteria bacterium]